MATESIANIIVKNIKSSDILKVILSIFTIPDVPVPPIDPTMILKTATNPGLSPRKIAAEIIARQSEAGAPFGPLPSGAENVAEKMELIRVQEMVKAFQQDARVTVSVPAGIAVISYIPSPVGPIPIPGTTVSPAHVSYAVIQ